MREEHSRVIPIRPEDRFKVSSDPEVLALLKRFDWYSVLPGEDHEDSTMDDEWSATLIEGLVERVWTPDLQCYFSYWGEFLPGAVTGVAYHFIDDECGRSFYVPALFSPETGPGFEYSFVNVQWQAGSARRLKELGFFSSVACLSIMLYPKGTPAKLLKYALHAPDLEHEPLAGESIEVLRHAHCLIMTVMDFDGLVVGATAACRPRLARALEELGGKAL